MQKASANWVTMDDRYTLGPVFLLHRRRYRDTSLLVELFSQHCGRVAAISRGVLAAKKSKSGLLQPFIPILVGWSGKGDIKTLTKIEPGAEAFQLKGKALYCGFYLNELIMYLTQRHDPHAGLYALYQSALHSLTVSTDIQAVLRRFELDMLTELGYQMELQFDAGTGEPVTPDGWYQYDPEQGPFIQATHSSNTVSGATLLKMHRNEMLLNQERGEAKRLMRSVLHFHLDGRPLKSKELFKGT